CVNALCNRDELDAEGFEFAECRGEMLQRATESVQLEHEDSIELTQSCRFHQSIERRSSVVRPTDAIVHMLCYDLEATTCGVLLQWQKLCVNVLAFVSRAHPCINRRFHSLPPCICSLRSFHLGIPSWNNTRRT